jgi:hypothetical protein
MDTEEQDTQQTDEERYAGWTTDQLISEITQLKKAQGGSDKAYQRERKERERLEGEVEKLQASKLEGSDELKDRSRDLDYREKLVHLREKALEDAVERGLPQSLGVRLAQDSEEETRQVMDEINNVIDEKSSEKTDAAIADRFEGKSKPQSAPQPQGMSYEQLLNMPDDYLAGIPGDRINKLLEKAAGGQ